MNPDQSKLNVSRFLWAFGIIFFCFILGSMTVGIFNGIQTKDEQTNGTWAEVVNQYQRRVDLIPNLVQVVQKYAAHEKDTFVGVAEARSKASSIQMTPEVLNNPAAFKKFQDAQGEIGSFLGRLMSVQEKYPELKADRQFIELQAQLEGTENRITVARNKYIKAVQEYNLTVRQFPGNIFAGIFGYSLKPQFTVENEKQISTAPKVEFK